MNREAAMENYSKDNIKRRMLGRIATLWDIEDIGNVDPVTGLLVEALSEEVFRLAGEVGNMDQRMLDKLSASLTPVEYATPRPCHALMKACTSEGTRHIGPETVFSCQESKTVRRIGLRRIDFIPDVENDCVLSAKEFTGITEKTEIQSTKENLVLSSGKEVINKSKSRKIRLS